MKEKGEEDEKRRKKNIEEEEIKEKVKKMETVLKKRNYTYDFDGNIIFIKPNKLEFPDEIISLGYNHRAHPKVVKTPYEVNIFFIYC